MIDHQQIVPLKLGIASFCNAGWMGGTYYLQNMLRALANKSQKVKILLFFISPEDPILIDPMISQLDITSLPGNGMSQKADWQSIKKDYDQWVKMHGPLDVCHSLALPIPDWINVPIVAWIPDFQHEHLPDFFSLEEIKARQYHLLQLAQKSKCIICSSQTALQDFKKLYPIEKNKAVMVQFSAILQPYELEQKIDPVKKYHLAVPFFLVSNQFWKHKNHLIVLKALRKLKQNSNLLFQVVFTGQVFDYRHPFWFGELLQKIVEWELRSEVIVLGHVSRQELFGLAMRSICMVQPSLFEGWNTIIEECRVCHIPILLSNIPVHREQAQKRPLEAIFFDSHDEYALAELMQNTFKKHITDRTPKKRFLDHDLIQRQARQYSDQLVDIWTKVKKISIS